MWHTCNHYCFQQEINPFQATISGFAQVSNHQMFSIHYTIADKSGVILIMYILFIYECICVHLKVDAIKMCCIWHIKCFYHYICTINCIFAAAD
jgi:hypothetical protein